MIPNILYAGMGICLSISLFNWCGLAVTQNISATSRSTIDTCRTLFIWMSSLALGWETFSWLQVVGFLVLIYGFVIFVSHLRTFLFNNVVPVPLFLQSIDDRAVTNGLIVEDVLIPSNSPPSTSPVDNRPASR
jgi:hypothetical protein